MCWGENMSKYSGKCDVYDCLSDRTDDYLQASTIYIGDTKLDIKCQRDLLPYYPFLVSCACTSQGKSTIYMTRMSYVDSHEREMLTFYMETAKRYYRRCKRKKVSFDVEEVIPQMTFCPQNVHREIAERVRDNGNKATIEGLSLDGITNHYRKLLMDDMVAAGYEEDYSRNWVYNKGNHFSE